MSTSIVSQSTCSYLPNSAKHKFLFPEKSFKAPDALALQFSAIACTGGLLRCMVGFAVRIFALVTSKGAEASGMPWFMPRDHGVLPIRVVWVKRGGNGNGVVW
ncbi:hypothetical protein BC938DRAFT_470585 [Jimgerdemannia flammicorona]|uniref:Uncharacterized protein n=1 Tax=Jimgerdemannia flammicorona TaxID=994334 RepID=A0A433QV79_9FUNG|nr:hypothetical protein BC938DRAFT_470585 [Jimgerdemannia flammicorona]